MDYKELVNKMLDRVEVRSHAEVPKGRAPRLINEANGDVCELAEAVELLEAAVEKAQAEATAAKGNAARDRRQRDNWKRRHDEVAGELRRLIEDNRPLATAIAQRDKARRVARAVADEPSSVAQDILERYGLAEQAEGGE